MIYVIYILICLPVLIVWILICAALWYFWSISIKEIIERTI